VSQSRFESSAFRILSRVRARFDISRIKFEYAIFSPICFACFLCHASFHMQHLYAVHSSVGMTAPGARRVKNGCMTDGIAASRPNMGAKPIAHLHLLSRLGMHGAIPPLNHVLMAWFLVKHRNRISPFTYSDMIVTLGISKLRSVFCRDYCFALSIT
jgi:hypothetical protein